MLGYVGLILGPCWAYVAPMVAYVGPMLADVEPSWESVAGICGCNVGHFS
jgi:hypothetical protein